MKITKQVRDYVALAVKELDEAGIPWEFEAGSKHHRLVYHVNGKPCVAIVSVSSSDRRAALNFRSQIRKSIR